MISALALVVFPLMTIAQGPSQQRVTSLYLYNFAKHIEWPADANSGTFDIALYRNTDTVLYDELRKVQENVTLNGRQIAVRQVNTIKSLSDYHMVYVGTENSNAVPDIYDAVGGLPVLLVTREYRNKHLVMINLMATPDNRLRFEVNKSNIINQGLTALPELILNGGTEIDVAALFREGQSSLVNLQKQLREREQSLDKLGADIKKQEAQNVELAARLILLGENIKSSDERLKTQRDQIEQQQQQIYASKNERSALQTEITSIRDEIDQKEALLQRLNSTISEQQTELVSQEGEISELDELVDSQQTALGYLRWLVALGVLLILTVIVAYITKQRDNNRLAARSEELRQARDKLAYAKKKAEEASRAKGEFLSLMSHELRTPLQAIIGYTDVVIEELSLDGEDHHIEDLNRVIRNSERLLKLINGVLDLAKIESGRIELNLVETRLSEIVDEAVGSVKPQLVKSGNELTVDVRDGEVLPKADKEKLHHVLLNLLSNAGKFTDNGRVTIKAYAEPKRIFMSVSDTGIGLTSEQQLQVFDRFKQVDSGATRKFQGSGLGLAISRQFCELMGGTIEVESELGQGATFIVDIPLPISPPSNYNDALQIKRDSETSFKNDDVNSLGPHIVMIDDDPAFLDIMARTMKMEGYNVHTAVNAEHGLPLAKKVKPDLITLDLLLPDQHGLAVFEQLKSDPDLKNIPVIIISILDDRSYIDDLKADEYLTKPIGREALRVAIDRVVARKSS